MKRFHLTYVQLFALGFFLLILLGAGLLCLPFSSYAGGVSFVDALFTATSATCVTGLIVYDTGACWTLFGKIVIITLIQIGGLGFMTVLSLFSLLAGRKFGLKERMFLQQTSGSLQLGGSVSLIREILKGTFCIEGAGALLLSIPFVRDFGWVKGIATAVFTSISAFCNAGFDVFGTGESIAAHHYTADPLVMIPVMLLILLGGIGFLIWRDFIRHGFKFRLYSLHSKLVLTVTVILLFGGALLFLLLERNASLAGLSWGEKILQSFFLSVTPRTAGFASVDYSQVSEAGWLLTVFLMVIGGNAGSTAGGLKITAFAVLVLSAVCAVRQSEQITVFKRRIEDKLVRQAAALLTLYVAAVLIGSTLISAFQPSLAVRDILFETVSAASTVGLTTGITPELCTAARLVDICLMFIGRVGSLTLLLLFSEKKKSSTALDRPVENILIG